MNSKKQASPVHYIVVLAFCFLFRFIPGFAGINELGMAILGCFIGAVYGWITIDMLWPSLIAILGVGLTSIGMTNVLAASIGNYIIVALILCMGVIGIAMKLRAFDWLAAKLLANKAMQGKTWITIWAVFALAWFLGFSNPIIMMIIFGAFVTSMLRTCGVQKNDKLAIFMYLGCALALMMGQILFPFLSTGLVFYGSYLRMFPQIPTPMGAYLVFMIIMGLLMVTVWTLMMKFVFRVDASPLKNFVTEESGVPKCTRDQKISLWLFLAFIVLNIIPTLPLGQVSTFMSGMGIVGITIAIIAIIPFIKAEDGTPLANFEELFHMCNWGQVWMVGFIMVMSTYMSQDTGITTAMALLFRMFAGLSPWVFIIVAIVVAVILTNVANNMLIGVLVMPFLVNFGAQAGINPTMLVVILFIMVQFAIATPAASPITAIAMTQELVDAKEMTKAALKALPILIVVGLIIGIPVAMGVFAVMG